MVRLAVLALMFGCVPLGVGCLSVPAHPDASDPVPLNVRADHRRTGESVEQRPRMHTVSHQEPVETPAPSSGFSGPTAVSDLIRYAVANHPEIARARHYAQSLFARIPQVSSLDDPQLTTTVFLDSIQTAAGPQHVILSLTQKLPWVGKREMRGVVAFHEAQAAVAELADVELAIAEQIKRAYYDLYYCDSAEEVYQNLDQRLVDVIESARVKYETNAAKFGLESVWQAELARSQLKIALAELRQTRERAVAQLRQAMHLPSDVEVEIEPIVETSTVSQDTAELLVATIERCHPQLEVNRQQVLGQDAAAELARLSFFPDVNVGFSWFGISPRGLSRVANGDDAFSVMIGVNLPVDRNKRYAAIAEARQNRAASTHRYRSNLDRLRRDVELAYADASAHGRVLKILNEELIEKSQQTLDLSLEAYRVDRIGYQQLIDAYEDYLRLRIAFHLRTARREQALASLERAVGCAVARGEPGDDNSAEADSAGDNSAGGASAEEIRLETPPEPLPGPAEAQSGRS